MASQEGKPDIFALENTFVDPAALLSFEFESLESVKDKCDVVLDTNVLLLPYTTDSNSLKEIQKIYESLKKEERLFVPGRVVREFAKNRAERVLEVWKALGDKTNSIKGPTRHSYPLLEDLPEYAEVTKLQKQLEDRIEDYKKAIRALRHAILDWGRGNDPVSVIYRTIFSAETIAEPNSTDYPNEKIEELLAYRNVNKVPPGYKDAAKDDRGIGDLLIWLTILSLGKERKKPLVFVTGDEKSDWFYRSDNRGLFPRYELVDKFRACSDGCALYVVSLSHLLQLFGAPDAVISAVRLEEQQTVELGGQIFASGSLDDVLIASGSELIQLARRDPREGIREGWECLAPSILKAAGYELGKTAPDSPTIGHALARLASTAGFPITLVQRLQTLQGTAIRAFNQSIYGFLPSPTEAEEYVKSCLRLRFELLGPA